MANPEHLAIPRQGVEACNRWRRENPEILPNLSDSNLSYKDLRHVDLSGYGAKIQKEIEDFRFTKI